MVLRAPATGALPMSLPLLTTHLLLSTWSYAHRNLSRRSRWDCSALYSLYSAHCFRSLVRDGWISLSSSCGARGNVF